MKSNNRLKASLIECNNNKPLFVGISAPQGCGKTTLTNILSQYFSSNNKICVSMSLDDFYLTDSPVDVVLFEGWMLGFNSYRSIDKTVDLLTDEMKTIDNYLSNYKPLHELFDCWLVLAVDDINFVFEWRAQAEREMRRSGRSAMTEEQVRDFVSRFIPAYKAYLPDLYTLGPQRKINSPIKKIVIGFDRLPINNAVNTNITSRL
eukprot:gene20803-26967_t